MTCWTTTKLDAIKTFPLLAKKKKRNKVFIMYSYIYLQSSSESKFFSSLYNRNIHPRLLFSVWEWKWKVLRHTNIFSKNEIFFFGKNERIFFFIMPHQMESIQAMIHPKQKRRRRMRRRRKKIKKGKRKIICI